MILISGVCPCNITNTGTTTANYLSANPHFSKSALARYTPWHFIELVQKHRIAFHEKELGQLFCDDSSKQNVAMLLAECDDAGVQVQTDRSAKRRVGNKCVSTRRSRGSRSHEKKKEKIYNKREKTKSELKI